MLSEFMSENRSTTYWFTFLPNEDVFKGVESESQLTPKFITVKVKYAYSRMIIMVKKKQSRWSFRKNSFPC